VKIRKWFGAQLLLSVVVGVLVAAGLWFLGVRYAILLGILAMILELVPVIGPVIVGVIAFLVAVSDSFVLGLYALVFFVAVQQFENHILIPMIIGKTMNVHPVVVVTSLLAGGKIAGFIGILLAVPIAVMAQETFDYLAEKKEKRRAAAA
jgi:predicted PurR-regulated permease PerM